MSPSHAIYPVQQREYIWYDFLSTSFLLFPFSLLHVHSIHWRQSDLFGFDSINAKCLVDQIDLAADVNTSSYNSEYVLDFVMGSILIYDGYQDVIDIKL